jgi:hypothetical protein
MCFGTSESLGERQRMRVTIGITDWRGGHGIVGHASDTLQRET